MQVRHGISHCKGADKRDIVLEEKGEERKKKKGLRGQVMNKGHKRGRKKDGREDE